MKNSVLVIITAVLVTSCATHTNTFPRDVSLIQLIATPEKYNGKTVRVEGYFHNKFEDSVLYLTKEHADRLDGKNGLWVSYADQETYEDSELLDCQWVSVTGVFVYESEYGHGHLGANSGRLDNVTRVYKIMLFYDGKIEMER